MLLLISNLIVKVIGVLFKIPLVSIIGDEGMGYFNSAYTIYTLFYTLSTAGLPVAVSILISESIAKNRWGDKKLIYKVTALVFFVIGILGSSFMLFGSRLLAFLIGSENSYLCIAAMSFVLLFVCMSSAMRGYFQGHQNMLPTAVSQIIESFGKLTVGMLLALYAIRCGYSSHVVAAYAILGITASSAVSMLYLLIAKNISDRKEGSMPNNTEKKVSFVVKKLFKTAIPITVSSAVMSLTNILDLSMVMRRLISIGYTQNEATAIYGNYSGLAVPMFNLPSAIIAPIALSVVPYITGARAANNMELANKTVKSAIKSAAILSCPCSFGLFLFASPILRLIFNDNQAERAAPLLSLLSIAIVGVSITTVTTALLQSYGKNNLPIISMVCGSAAKLISGYFLIGKLGMEGTPISTVICYLVTAGMNFIFLKVHTHVKFDVAGMLLKPLLSSLLSCGIGYLVFRLCLLVIAEELCCIIAMGVSALMYFALILLLKAVDRDDAKIFPGGRFIEKYFIRGA